MEGWMPFGGSLVLLLAAAFAVTDGAHREHKVHNIVLYPDKHSWCQTLQIKQVISYPGCKSEEIDNNVCVGACFSYSIPHTEPSDPGEVIVPYCDSCQPSDTTWHHITLECPKNSPETPPQLVKRVQIINNCSCSSCEKTRQQNGAENHARTPNNADDDFLGHDDDDNVPDLLKVLNNRNETNVVGIDGAHVETIKSITNHKIVALLQNIQEKNSPYDKEQLIELLRMIEGPDANKLTDKTIGDFVESLNSENVELDLMRLRQVLAKFERSKYFENHRKYADSSGEQDGRHYHGVGSAAVQLIVPQSGSTVAPEQNHGTDSIETKNNGEDNGDSIRLASDHDDNDDDILSPPFLSSSKRQPPDPVIDSILNHRHADGDNDATAAAASASTTPNHHHGHAHHHHHVGEKVAGHAGHLTKGPNGALVIQPDRIREKLDVNPHELKPNHAGTLMTYSGQSVGEKLPKSHGDVDGDDID